MDIIFFIIYIIIFILALSFAIGAVSFAPWVPCHSRDLARIFKLANLKEGEIFYDLGCGDGKTVFYAGRKYKAKAIGLEIAMPMYLTCKIKQFLRPNRNIKFKYKNLFKEDLSNADVIYFFGLTNTIKDKLRKKLEKELKPGARVISYVFPVEEWKPTLIDKPGDKDNSIFLYVR